MNYKISVVMPVFNCENYVRSAIDSVVNQTYPNFELIIVDDCSKDKTFELCKQYQDKRIKIFRNEKNCGGFLY